ncbi:MAG: alpha/beta hydrolase fold domain-containing protein [Frankiaceae bacterium]
MTTTLNEEASWATLPGRLGRPELELRTDPRSDPRMVAALAPFGMDTAAAPPPIDGTAGLETRLEFCATAEIGFEAMFDALMTGLPEISGLTRSTETFQGVDGDQIQLFIARPADARGPLPCVLHIHGGGMVILRAANAAYVRFREELAATGVVVIGVEYRNGAGVLGNNPFPAGLNDCASALNWVHSHRDQLRITTITVAGESGGGNLALATTLKAKQDRRLHMIDGVYAMVPYISGAYGWCEADRARELPSLVENDRYFMSCATAEILASAYDPEGSHDRDPLCWPYHASAADLADLPPHVITVNELDPLRDEGLAYYRKLLHAGVNVTGRTVLGVCHAGDLMFRRAIPDVYAATVNDLHRFAASR